MAPDVLDHSNSPQDAARDVLNAAVAARRRLIAGDASVLTSFGFGLRRFEDEDRFWRKLHSTCASQVFI